MGIAKDNQRVSQSQDKQESVLKKFFYRILSILYRSAVYINRLLYLLGIRKKKYFPKFIISIGNITAGGTGKTPVTAYVCRALISKGCATAILTRGYGSHKKQVPLIFSGSDGTTYDPKLTGDEPLMLSEMVPEAQIYVYHDRLVSADLASVSNDLLVMDDGYQRMNIHKDINILLIDHTQLFGNEWFLPAGPLRMPISSISETDCILITKIERSPSPDIIRRLNKLNPTAPVFTHSYSIASLERRHKTEDKSYESIKGKSVLLFSGIANPSSFEDLVLKTGAKIISKFEFPDHASYTSDQIHQVNIEADRLKVDFVITTEKDAVKLDKFGNATQPWLVLKLAHKFDEGFFDFIWDRYKKNHSH